MRRNMPSRRPDKSDDDEEGFVWLVCTELEARLHCGLVAEIAPFACRCCARGAKDTLDEYVRSLRAMKCQYGGELRLVITWL